MSAPPFTKNYGHLSLALGTNVPPELAGLRNTFWLEGWTPPGLLMGSRGAEGVCHPSQIQNSISDAKYSVMEAVGVCMALNNFWTFCVDEYIDVLETIHFYFSCFKVCDLLGSFNGCFLVWCFSCFPTDQA